MATPTIALYTTLSDPSTAHSSPETPFTLAEFFTWSDARLEMRHDYIQHLFPLPESSMFNLDAPILTSIDRRAFLRQDHLRAPLRRVFDRMALFYGFTVRRAPAPANSSTTATATFTPATTSTHTSPSDPSNSVSTTSKEDHLAVGNLIGIEFSSTRRQCAHWLTPFGHNHLRITRIIRSLRILGLTEEAHAFHRALVGTDAAQSSGEGIVGAQSKRFWRRAAEAPLCDPPDPRDARVAWLVGET